ncbi:MAG: hypothetical protein H7840_02555 [Alphaproteobacteria bacterium]
MMSDSVAMIVVNTVITLMCIWAAMYVNVKILQPTLRNERRFVLYGIRDRLALLAMRGLIDEHSKEYRSFSWILNRSIQATGGFTATAFFRHIYTMSKDKHSFGDVVSAIIKQAQDSRNDEFQALLLEYFTVMRDITKKELRFILWSLPLAVLLSRFLEKSKVGPHNRFQIWLTERIDHAGSITKNLVGRHFDRIDGCC